MLLTRVICCTVIILTINLLLTETADAEFKKAITVQLENGTLESSVSLENVNVTLHVISSSSEAVLFSETSQDDGLVLFDRIPVEEDIDYLFVAEYQGVLYYKFIDQIGLEDYYRLTVYDTTGSLDEILVEEQSVVVGSIDTRSRLLTVYERVTLLNQGDRTFVPDLEQPQNMQFLRFSLPRNATDLQVETNFNQGEVMIVDRGFGLTSTVTPGSYFIDYVYTVPYLDDSVDIMRSFPNRTSTFRILMPNEFGSLLPLSNELPSQIVIQGKKFNLWESENIESGSRLEFILSDLPEPTMAEILGAYFDSGSWLGLGLGAVTGLLLFSLAIYALGRIRSEEAQSSKTKRPNKTIRYESLFKDIIQLEMLYRDHGIGWSGYRRDRKDLKLKLVEEYFLEEGSQK